MKVKKDNDNERQEERKEKAEEEETGKSQEANGCRLINPN